MDLTLNNIISNWIKERDYKSELRATILGQYQVYVITPPLYDPTAMMILEDKIQFSDSMSLSNHMGKRPMGLDYLVAEISAVDHDLFTKLEAVLHRQARTTYLNSPNSVYVHSSLIDASMFPNQDAFITF